MKFINVHIIPCPMHILHVWITLFVYLFSLLNCFKTARISPSLIAFDKNFFQSYVLIQ